ncbi:2-phospho-L-lactate transferase [Salinilacustrithrix flava]|uniref:2-phospho-L-lactate transferase n=1 Tax=Salinilacustrithrix flava TaxID=2957203 RepID=UPI003D7C1F09
MSDTAVLCGGVGAARFLRGLLAVVPPSSVTAIVNVADDTELHGLHISPDIDTVTYTLADAIDPDRGWGLRDETWHAMTMFERYGNPSWFNLGDKDLATHIVRTERLRAGQPLSEVTAHLARAWDLECTLLPVTDDRLRTFVTTEHGDLSFQEYFVGRQHAVPITAVRFEGAERARPAPGVLDALADADRIVVAPSNPIVSIGPLLAVDGIRDALVEHRSRVVAVSPIIAGAALKGPADRMLTELGHEPSVVGVARLYRDVAATLVIDDADAARAPEVEAEGMACIVTGTVMSDAERAAGLARAVLAATESPR